MKKISNILVVVSLFLAGCGFGEYADTDKEETIHVSHKADGTKIYTFTQKSIKDKSFFKVFKIDDQWNMSQYDFNATHFKANQIKGGDAVQTGTYSITEDGYLKLTTMDTITYAKPTKKDDDKIYLLWTNVKSELSKTQPSQDTYFFKSKEKADKFIEQ